MQQETTPRGSTVKDGARAPAWPLRRYYSTVLFAGPVELDALAVPSEVLSHSRLGFQDILGRSRPDDEPGAEAPLPLTFTAVDSVVHPEWKGRSTTLSSERRYDPDDLVKWAAEYRLAAERRPTDTPAEPEVEDEGRGDWLRGWDFARYLPRARSQEEYQERARALFYDWLGAEWPVDEPGSEEFAEVVLTQPLVVSERSAPAGKPLAQYFTAAGFVAVVHGSEGSPEFLIVGIFGILALRLLSEPASVAGDEMGESIRRRMRRRRGGDAEGGVTTPDGTEGEAGEEEGRPGGGDETGTESEGAST